MGAAVSSPSRTWKFSLPAAHSHIKMVLTSISVPSLAVEAGGAGGTTSQNNGAGGGGGGSGVQGIFDITANVTVTIGSGGNGAASNSAGSDGGGTVFGSLITCPGGSGAPGTGTSALGGRGGITNTPSASIFTGETSDGAMGGFNTLSVDLPSGWGGNSPFRQSGGEPVQAGGGAQVAGNDGVFGGGGGGASNRGFAANISGGDGGDGYVIVMW